jgi:hypothetical protein
MERICTGNHPLRGRDARCDTIIPELQGLRAP